MTGSKTADPRTDDPLCACSGGGVHWRPCGFHWARLGEREREDVRLRLGIGPADRRRRKT